MEGDLTGILAVTVGTFEYVFDDLASLEAQGLVLEDPLTESRLVYVCGHSSPQQKERDDYRLRGWIGRTHQAFGAGWDKGHYIGNALGGAVDRLEINVFVQRRDLLDPRRPTRSVVRKPPVNDAAGHPSYPLASSSFALVQL